MATALDVVKFFVEQAMLDQTTVCPLKAQKLLYYGQGYELAVVEEPLFGEEIEAWQYGPVVPRVYRELKGRGGAPITSDWCYGSEWSPPFGDATTRVLLHVWHWFGALPPGRLVHMSHGEEPWRVSFRSGENRTITKETLADFFGEQRKALTLQVSGVPPKRTCFARWSEFNGNPAPWLRAARTGAVVRVLEDEGETVRAEFGHHHSPEYYRDDDDVEGGLPEGAGVW